MKAFTHMTRRSLQGPRRKVKVPQREHTTEPQTMTGSEPKMGTSIPKHGRMQSAIRRTEGISFTEDSLASELPFGPRRVE